MRLFRGLQGARDTSRAVVGRDSSRGGPDNGPVIVLVDSVRGDADTLEWAAAEAAARGSELRIVHAFRWPHVFDPFGNLSVDLQARGAAEGVVVAARRRARRIASSVRITALVYPGGAKAALVSEARKTTRALVVVGHDRRDRTLSRRLARRTTASLAVIGLSDQAAVGPSLGRVVVGDGGPQALGFAFRAARRRGTGVTIVDATPPNGDLEDLVRLWRMAYPEVDVRWRIARGPADGAVLAESAAAALTVLGPVRRRRISGSTSDDVLRLARGPVVMVGPGTV
ncbi:universal stress protein [Kribbella sp. NBC_00359]|uniref:universal stress protein n=1 Tax=Kribbella sp. NBC_00359 TaxID=2975966 RepID=UPI002E23A1EE